jgi:hypothetical protein
MGPTKLGGDAHPTGSHNAENLSENEVAETEFLAKVCAVSRDYGGVC